MDEEIQEPPDYEVRELSSGQIIRCHPETECFGELCCIHNPSDHALKDAEQYFRYDRGIMERICEHGVGHPDPDDYNVWMGYDSGVHGCDGCCAKPKRDVTFIEGT